MSIEVRRSPDNPNKWAIFKDGEVLRQDGYPRAYSYYSSKREAESAAKYKPWENEVHGNGGAQVMRAKDGATYREYPLTTLQGGRVLIRQIPGRGNPGATVECESVEEAKRIIDDMRARGVPLGYKSKMKAPPSAGKYITKSQATDASLPTNLLAVFGLYAIWKALSAPSRFDMPAGSGYKAAMELKGQGWDAGAETLQRGSKFKYNDTEYVVLKNEGKYTNGDGATFVDLRVKEVDKITGKGRGERLLSLRA